MWTRLLILLTCVFADDLWAVLVNTSKFWFNYRHTSNMLMIYQTLKRLGVDDDHIIVMQPDATPCSARNPNPTQVFDGHHSENLNAGNIQIDYRGVEVTPENILRVLTDRHPADTPASKRLRSGPDSRVLVFMNGHGGDGYLKVQDTMVIRTAELTDAVNEMRVKKRYRELLIAVDTCQALSLFKKIDLPSVHLLGSSLVGEMGKSIGHHSELGLSTADRFTFYTYKFLRDKSPAAISRLSLANWLDFLSADLLLSHIGYKSQTSPSDIQLKTFFLDSRKTFETKATHVQFSPVQWKTRETKVFKAEEQESTEARGNERAGVFVSVAGLVYFLVILIQWARGPTLSL